MLKKIILTDSPEEFTKKSYDKLILTKDPAHFIKVVESLCIIYFTLTIIESAIVRAVVRVLRSVNSSPVFPE